MSIPTPPTDSLYKFCALAGLIIIGLAIFLTITQTNNVSEQLVSTKLILDKFEIESEYLKEEYIDYKKTYKSFLETYTTMYKHGRGNMKLRDSLNTRLDESNAKIDYLSNKNKELRIKLVEIESLNRNTKRLYINGIVSFIFSIIFIYFGLRLSCYGFKSWYYRIQIYQDEILKKQAVDMLKTDKE